MNWLTAVKNFVIGAPKMADDLFDKEGGLLVKAGGFLNDLHYSDVERTRDAIAIGQGVTKFVETSLNESTWKSRTRRVVSIVWIISQLTMLFATMFARIFNRELASDFFEIATCKIMFYGTGSVIAFFFGGYVWGTYLKGSFKKKKE